MLLLAGCETAHYTSTTPPSAASTPTPSLAPLRPSTPATSLNIAGAFSASTAPERGENACFFGQPFLELRTPQMALSDGQWIGVDIFMPSTIGSFSVESPAGDGRPIVSAFRHTRSAGGGQTGQWLAVSGSVEVARAENVGDPAAYGVVSGSVDVRLALPGGKQPITLRGNWGCVIEPVANRA